MTKREMFVKIATVNANDTEIVEFCNHQIDLLDARKDNKSKSMTKTQKENEGIKAIILEILTEIEGKMTVTEILQYDDRLSAYSNQKISALLRQMTEAKTVVKTIEGKKSYFQVAVE